MVLSSLERTSSFRVHFKFVLPFSKADFGHVLFTVWPSMNAVLRTTILNANQFPTYFFPVPSRFTTHPNDPGPVRSTVSPYGGASLLLSRVEVGDQATNFEAINTVTMWGGELASSGVGGATVRVESEPPPFFWPYIPPATWTSVETGSS